jgi:hypothetical protein
VNEAIPMDIKKIANLTKRWLSAKYKNMIKDLISQVLKSHSLSLTGQFEDLRTELTQIQSIPNFE